MTFGQSNFQGQTKTPLTFQYDWNMNKEFLGHLVYLITKVNEAASLGDILGWYNNLKTLYRNVAGLLLKTQEGQIKCYTNAQITAVFEEIRKLFPTIDTATSSDMAMKVARSRQQIIQQKLDTLNIEIITAMHINKLIMPRQKNDVEFAALELN